MKLLESTKRFPNFMKRYFRSVLIVMLSFAVFIGISGFKSEKINSVNSVMSPGVVFEIEVTDHEQSPPKTEEMEVIIEGRNIAIPVSSSDDRNGSGKMIYRGDRGKNGEVIVTDDDRKGYYVIDEAFAKTMKGNIAKSKSMMDDVMKNLTKEQREMIEKAQKKGGTKIPGFNMQKPRPKPVLRNTKQRGTKSGYPCVKYEVLVDGQKIRELWVTDWSNVEGGSEAEDAFKSMAGFFEEMMDSFSDLTEGGLNPYEEMNFEDGFPVVMRTFGEDGGLEDESVLRSTRRQRIDPSAFEPPSGYKRMSMGPR